MSETPCVLFVPGAAAWGPFNALRAMAEVLRERSQRAVFAIEESLRGVALELAIDEDASRDRILALTGASTEDVDLTLGLIAEKEFKRHQHPPGLRISRRAFGRDRRMPITNLYTG